MSQPNVTEPWRLLELARATVPQSRYDLATSITDLYESDEGALNPREEKLIEEILGRLLGAFEIDLRRALATRLAGSTRVPHELLLMLCNDEIEVARPLLRHSRLLDSEALLGIVARRGEAHHLAIAGRDSLEVAVTEALVGTANLAVIEALLRNPGASFSAAALEHLVEEARRVECFRAPLAHRDDLGLELARQLYGLVSVALRQHILGAYDIDAGELDAALEDVLDERASPAPASGGVERSAGRKGGLGERSELPALNVDLVGAQEITPQILLRVLRNGQIALFESLLGELACLSKDRISLILAQPGGRALAVVCRALGIAKPDYAVMLFLARRLRGTGESDDPRSIARMIEFYGDLDPMGSLEALRRWRRDSDYRDSIAALERKGPAGPARAH